MTGIMDTLEKIAREAGQIERTCGTDTLAPLLLSTYIHCRSQARTFSLVPGDPMTRRPVAARSPVVDDGIRPRLEQLESNMSFFGGENADEWSVDSAHDCHLMKAVNESTLPPRRYVAGRNVGYSMVPTGDWRKSLNQIHDLTKFNKAQQSSQDHRTEPSTE